MANPMNVPHKVLVNFDVRTAWGLDTRSIILDTVYTTRASARTACVEFMKSDKASEMNARSAQTYAVAR